MWYKSVDTFGRCAILFTDRQTDRQTDAHTDGDESTVTSLLSLVTAQVKSGKMHQ